MATNLGEFHTLVSDALGKGTSLDSVIPKRVGMAAGWIERNYTFQYMRTWKTFTADPDAEFPHIVSLYDLDIKKIDLIRIKTTEADGSVLFSRPLLQLAPADRETRSTGVPESFWLNGVSSIVFNSVPDVETVFEAHLVQFSRWGSGNSWTHWLLDNATELLLCKTLTLMAVRTRDPKLYQMYESDLAKEIQAFNVAEENLRSGTVVSRWEPPEYASHESLRSA